MPSQPNFRQLLSNPTVEDRLPYDFNVNREAIHLERLYSGNTEIQAYDFNNFIFAGGSGMVFKVSPSGSSRWQAMKIIRAHLYEEPHSSEDIAESLSPVSQNEIMALESMSHPNVVHLYKAIAQDNRVVAICTTFVEPRTFDNYIRETLKKKPKTKRVFSPARLQDSCSFLIDKCTEVADALVHMHNQNIYHFDIKPANILISSPDTSAVITDLGSSVCTDSVRPGQEIRVYFDWTYAHPDLQNMVRKPAGITGGLKCSSQVNPNDGRIERYDLFAFGRTIQELLAVLDQEFGERCYADYGFRFLHLIASLLLDGNNAILATNQQVNERDGKRFISDVAMGYPVNLYQRTHISSTKQLLDLMHRYKKNFSWYKTIPEMDDRSPDVINTGISGDAPFTHRVAEICNHPSMYRLKSELQLGWVKEVYPGATHSRWSHSIGVFAAVVQYVNGLIADTEVPTFRILVKEEDIHHAFVSALLHDIGQTEFGHDMEAACPWLYNQKNILVKLLKEKYWGEETLENSLKTHWPLINIDRIKTILDITIGVSGYGTQSINPIDGIISDIINGPIDADKYDYLTRDSISCGVVYGRGIDLSRLIKSLSIDVSDDKRGGCRLALAYKAKGASAINSILLGRLQMYHAVYWHHAVRCLQAMFIHCIASTFPFEVNETSTINILGLKNISPELLTDIFYNMVICGRMYNDSLVQCHAPQAIIRASGEKLPPEISNNRALEFIWRFADSPTRKLLSRLAKRDIYKRIFEIKVEELPNIDFSTIKSKLTPNQRAMLAKALEERFLVGIYKKLQDSSPDTESTSTSEARDLLVELRKKDMPRIVIDFPSQGISEETNWPREISDPARKYIGSLQRGERVNNIFNTTKKMQLDMASVRIFAAPELHDLIIRYLSPADIKIQIDEVIPILRGPN